MSRTIVRYDPEDINFEDPVHGFPIPSTAS